MNFVDPLEGIPPRGRGGPRRKTLLVVAALEALVNHATGDLTPEIDEIAMKMRELSPGVYGSRLKLPACQEIIDLERHTFLTAALKHMLESSGWLTALVTQHYLDRYKGQKPDHPGTDPEINACVSGRGHARSTAAVHFHVRTENCVLCMMRDTHGNQSGTGGINASTRRMEVAVDQGQLDGDGVEAVIVAGFGPGGPQATAHRIRRLRRAHPPQIKP